MGPCRLHREGLYLQSGLAGCPPAGPNLQAQSAAFFVRSSPFPTSHSCPQLLDGRPQGKRSKFPIQETFKTMHRTHGGPEITKAISFIVR